MKFVLVHGGWQGGWVWDEVSRLLEPGGHEVFAPTLRGMEEDVQDRAGVTLSGMAEGVLDELQQRTWADPVLVGHSGGGPIVQYIADRLGERVRRIVFMSAWVLREGESINDIRPRHEVEAARLAASRSPAATVPMDVDKWASRFMQDATPAQFAEATARLVPTPIGWLDEPVTLPRFFDLELPAGYVFLRDDLSAPRELFQQMADRLHDPRIVEADGGHQAMLTRPGAVAAALLTAAADDTTDS